MKPKMIIWDFDDTLFKWSPHYVTWLFNNHPYDIDTHDTKTWFNLDFIKEFNNSPSFLERDDNNGYQELYYFISCYRPDINQVILSACGKGLQSKLYDIMKRQKNGYFDTIKLEDIECEDSSYDKYQHILKHTETHEVFVIDDKKETIEFCHKNNIKGACNLKPDDLKINNCDFIYSRVIK